MDIQATTSTRVKDHWLAIFAILMVSNSLVSSKHSDSTCYGLSKGKDFIIGFTYNLGIYDRRFSILVAAFSDQVTEVAISSKHEVNGQPLYRTASVNPRGYQIIDLPYDYVMEGTERSYKGIRVTASSDVSVFSQSHFRSSPAGFLGIPIQNLGMKYVVVTPKEPSGSMLSEPSLFAVIGTQDSTSVRVTLSTTGYVVFEGETYYSGDVIHFMVNELEAVQIQGRSTDDMTGTIIQSDKHVSAFSGRYGVSTQGSALDATSEQLIPEKSWGYHHLYTAYSDLDSNYYSIVAYLNDTRVTIPDEEAIDLNSGDFWEGRVTGSGLVSSSKPTSMMQLLATINGSVVDPAYMQIPSEEHFGPEFRFTTPPRSELQGFFNFLNIVVKKDSQDTVKLNDVPITEIATHVSDIPDTDYIKATIEVPQGEGLYYVKQADPNGSPFSVIVYGYEEKESYGFAAGLFLPSNTPSDISLSPFYFRELGGEVVEVTLSCIQSSYKLELENAICKFDIGIGEVLILGDRLSPDTIHCVTPTFYRLGLTEVQVSLDNGDTFPYSGEIYVSSQEDLLPLLTVEQANWEVRDWVVDLTVNDELLLSWDPSIFEEDVSHLDILVQNFDMDSNGVPVLGADETILMSAVENNGNVDILPELIRSHFEDKNADDRNGVTPIAAFSLRPSTVQSQVPIGILAVVFGGAMVSLYESLQNCDTYESILLDEPQNVPPCPCTFAQANSDKKFEISNAKLDFFHPGAANCFRASSTTSESGQQCCYKEDGNILVGPPGGGTEDTYSPDGIVGTSLHFLYDEVPWYACCQNSNQCDNYYAHRRSDDCSEYSPIGPAKCAGDPHMITLDGKEFTFNGAGEFQMLSSLLETMTVQARMEVYRDTEASVFSAVAVKIDDSAKVQVERLRTNETSVLIDGKPLYLASSPIRVHGFDGVQISSTQDLTEVKLVFKAGVVLIFHMQADFMSFIVQLDEKFKEEVHGLLGNFNGDPEDDFQFPNGTIIGDLSSLEEIHEYALTWMIAEEDSIFRYVSPYDYNSYHFPDFMPTFDIPNPENVSQEIKDVCGDSVECIFDAVQTGSLLFANETLVVSATFDKIQESAVKIISCGFPGTVPNGEISGQVYLVDSILHITCDDGYTSDGSSMLICNPDGNWSSDLPQCVPSGKEPGKNPVNKTAIILGVTLGCAALVVAIVSVFVVVKVNKNKK